MQATKDVTVATPKNIIDFSPETLIAQAIDKGLSAETMEKFLAMRREWMAERAKMAFDRAMAEFQAECPMIEKSKKVDFTSKRTGSRTTYSYAPIEAVISQVKALLQKHGFSYSVNTKTNGSVTAICKITHEMGHSEESEFSVPIDKESFMNAQQQVASALTFAKRYAFLNGFGIMTGDEDNDATHFEQKPFKSPVSNLKPEQAQVINQPGKVVPSPVKEETKPILSPAPNLKLQIKQLLDLIDPSIELMAPEKQGAEYTKLALAKTGFSLADPQMHRMLVTRLETIIKKEKEGAMTVEDVEKSFAMK